MEKHGRVDFDERNLPRLVFGPGEAICVECVEWVRLLDYHAENGSVATSRFEEGDLVLRTGTEELYEVLEARLTGISTAGVWFPTYTCQRIEIRQGTGKILPACMGLLFEIPDCELQPVPPRYKLPASRTLGLKDRRKSVDLVGAVRDRLAITSDVRKRPSPTLPEPSPSVARRKTTWAMIRRFSKLPSYLTQAEIRALFTAISNLRDRTLFGHSAAVHVLDAGEDPHQGGRKT